MVKLTQEEIVEIIEELDAMAQDYDGHRYGLPVHSPQMNQMINRIDTIINGKTNNIQSDIQDKGQ
jgi:SMC interacting uncharacterized protein involved in chromosome segregation